MRWAELRFWLVLAKRLGMSLARCMREVDAREFSLWMAFDRLDPLGDERGDVHAARIVWASAGEPGTSPRDFLTEWGTPREYTPEEIFESFGRAASRGRS